MLEPGDHVLLLGRAGENVILPVSHSLRERWGSIASKQHPEDFAKIRGKVKQRLARDVVEN